MTIRNENSSYEIAKRTAGMMTLNEFRVNSEIYPVSYQLVARLDIAERSLSSLSLREVMPSNCAGEVANDIPRTRGMQGLFIQASLHLRKRRRTGPPIIIREALLDSACGAEHEASQ
jgi:hypothetical protein